MIPKNDMYTLQQNVYNARSALRKISEVFGCSNHAAVADSCGHESIKLNIARVALENAHAQHVHH